MDRSFFAELSAVARAAVATELERGLVADNKSSAGFDPVTEADRAAERGLRALIEQHYPQHGIWGEEYGMSRPDAPIRWSLDPVDGTRALVCGLPSWAVLVGLLEDGHHIAGMIDLPALDECLVAVGGGTLRNGRTARSSGCDRLAEARLSTTDPNLFIGHEFEAFERVRTQCRLTRFGLDAMAYARIATGDLDLVVENGLKPHDYDALVAVVRGAGGHIGDWVGGDDFSGGRIVAAASRSLYDQAVEQLNA
ncbi:histidinol phosphate phosphatase [Sphingomonas sp. NSE70-1]|uniref:Histidinol phosphate phosphatase n=1 Tax=Sphingomonas caseinilyticus TaxID=2908205 RepID=A0ABT0RU68_9SPHN|nr:inositol monophosphatase family protein [Sphingomonas caseinilyticus]MCL6698584.1 histidinol phosphate phosphatase [Sphingomonas caseinilyticus]